MAVTPDHPGYEDCKTPETFRFYHDVDERNTVSVLAAQSWMATEDAFPFPQQRKST
jgi:hypothetical protein